jgi:hypothetical protein
MHRRILYTAKYRKLGSIFWHKLKDVKSDGYVDGAANTRWFVTEDGYYTEVCMSNVEIRFSPERADLIEEQNKKKLEEALKSQV